MNSNQEERDPPQDYTDLAAHETRDALRQAGLRPRRPRFPGDVLPSPATGNAAQNQYINQTPPQHVDDGIPWSFTLDGSIVPFPIRAAQLASGTIIIRIGCTSATIEQWTEALHGNAQVGGYRVLPERRPQLNALLVLISEAYAPTPDYPEAAAVACTGTDQLPAGFPPRPGRPETAPTYRDDASSRAHGHWLQQLDARIRELEARR